MQPAGPQQYQITYLDLFDTVTTVIGFGETEEEFQTNAEKIHEQLLTYHQLFDIYHTYDGVPNLKTVNDNAGVCAVQVDEAIIQLLLDCKAYYTLTGGKVNVAMGSVLKLWHTARTESLQNPEKAQIPTEDALKNAAEHMDFDKVLVDKVASTVYILDPEMSLDVGAIAKGWAVQKVAETAPEGMLISAGGNVCVTGAKLADGAAWNIGIQDPQDSSAYLRTVAMKKGAIVTSGDYQRTFTVENVAYHHIIDPQTQMPANKWQSVTVIAEDSALADALSTALFLLPLEDGKTLAKQCDVSVCWLDTSGNEFLTDGFPE